MPNLQLVERSQSRDEVPVRATILFASHAPPPLALRRERSWLKPFPRRLAMPDAAKAVVRAPEPLSAQIPELASYIIGSAAHNIERLGLGLARLCRMQPYI